VILEVYDALDRKRLLAESKLDLLVAGAMLHEQHFFSAHNREHSVVAIVNPDRSVQVFDVIGATEAERVEYLNSVRDQECVSA
jgi:hypothetical protein